AGADDHPDAAPVAATRAGELVDHRLRGRMYSSPVCSPCRPDGPVDSRPMARGCSPAVSVASVLPETTRIPPALT
ncbi:hypothetical protein ACWDPV_16590, partial [Gordonia sp. NPDC003504]